MQLFPGVCFLLNGSDLEGCVAMLKKKFGLSCGLGLPNPKPPTPTDWWLWLRLRIFETFAPLPSCIGPWYANQFRQFVCVLNWSLLHAGYMELFSELVLRINEDSPCAELESDWDPVFLAFRVFNGASELGFLGTGT